MVDWEEGDADGLRDELPCFPDVVAGFGLCGGGDFAGAGGFVGAADGEDESVGEWSVRVCDAAGVV